MLKKIAFSLAEVLVTLTVIGVIASLTIPVLLQDINNAHFKAAWKKSFSDLSQATMQLANENGGSLKGAFDETGKVHASASENLKNAFANKLNVVKNCSGTTTYGGNANGASIDECWHRGGNLSYLNKMVISGDQVVPGLVLANGNLVTFNLQDSNCTTSRGSYKACGVFLIDVNGFKGPNIMGKDIFAVSLTENTLIPYGALGYNDPTSTCVEGVTLTGVAETMNKGQGCSAKYLYE